MKFPPPEFHMIQKEHEFAQLLLLFQFYKPRRILELGVGFGGTFWAWMHNCEPESILVAVSLFTGTDMKDLREDLKRWAVETRNDVTAINGRTEDPKTVAEVKRLAPFDWLHIDASHRYDDVRRDYEVYGQMVRDGGTIVFHDIGVPQTIPKGQGHLEVRYLWDELARTHRTTQIIDDQQDSSNCFGIGVLFK